MKIVMGSKLGSFASSPNEGADAVLLNIGIRRFLLLVSNSQ